MVSCHPEHVSRIPREAQSRLPRASPRTAYRFPGPSPRLPPRREKLAPAAGLAAARDVCVLMSAQAGPRRDRQRLLCLSVTAPLPREPCAARRATWAPAGPTAQIALPGTRCPNLFL